MTTQHREMKRWVGRRLRLFVAAWVALTPAIVLGEPAEDLRLRQINRLIAQHPHVNELIGPGISILSIDGRLLLSETYYSDWDGQDGWVGELYFDKGYGEILDLSRDMVDFGALVVCRGRGLDPDPPYRKAGCWCPFDNPIGRDLDPLIGMAVKFDQQDEVASAAIVAAIEDLLVMLRAREDALR